MTRTVGTGAQLALSVLASTAVKVLCLVDGGVVLALAASSLGRQHRHNVPHGANQRLRRVLLRG